MSEQFFTLVFHVKHAATMVVPDKNPFDGKVLYIYIATFVLTFVSRETHIYCKMHFICRHSYGNSTWSPSNTIFVPMFHVKHSFCWTFIRKSRTYSKRRMSEQIDFYLNVSHETGNSLDVHS